MLKRDMLVQNVKYLFGFYLYLHGTFPRRLLTRHLQ